MVPDPNGYVCVGRSPVLTAGTTCAGRGIVSRTGASWASPAQRRVQRPEQAALHADHRPVKTAPGSRADPATGYRSVKDAGREKPHRDITRWFLSTYGIKAELTATANCGFQRYTFPRAEQANILIDLANCRSRASGAEARFLDERTIEGSQTSGKETVYFRAVFSKDFSASGT